MRLLDGLDLISYIFACTNLLILDAVRACQSPGALRRPPALAQKLSMHQLGLQNLLAAYCGGGAVQEIDCWGV